MDTVRFFIIILLMPVSAPVCACGWWGDSEMTSRRDTAVIAPDGSLQGHTLSLKSMKLPEGTGYSIAVPEPGRAIPYLLATDGQPVFRIKDFRIFGFHSVIDLGTPTATARLHRSETEAAGMLYFSVPVESNMPNPGHIQIFNRIVLNARNGPILVYAPSAELIAITWAFYRLSLGSPLEFVLSEGRSMGLTEEQEEELRDRISDSN